MVLAPLGTMGESMRCVRLLCLIPFATGCASPGDDTGDTDTCPACDTDTSEVAHLVLTDSFETPEQLPGGGFTAGTPDHWTVMSSSAQHGIIGLFRPGLTSMTSAEPLATPGDGNQTAYLHASGNGSDQGWVIAQRDLVGAAETDRTYTARVAVGVRLDIPTTNYVTLSLGIHEASVADPSPMPWTSRDIATGTDLVVGELREFELTWTATAADAGRPVSLQITAQSLGSAEGDHQVLVDNVRGWIGTPE